jgi:DNA-binding MarR family transcriptional regulator
MKQYMRETFGYLMSTCNNHLVKLLNRNFSKHNLDLTREQFVVLNTLWGKGIVNQQIIADILNKDKYSITKLIDGLEKRKLVKRVPSATDRRLKNVELTTKAHKIKPKIEEVTNSTIELALEGISTTELETTFNTLSKIIENIQGNEK